MWALILINLFCQLVQLTESLVFLIQPSGCSFTQVSQPIFRINSWMSSSNSFSLFLVFISVLFVLLLFFIWEETHRNHILRSIVFYKRVSAELQHLKVDKEWLKWLWLVQKVMKIMVSDIFIHNLYFISLFKIISPFSLLNHSPENIYNLI